MTLPASLFDRPFAHRGLWRSGGCPENSLAAFDAACRHGYGIELDVRLSADGEAMVFHDDTLERLTAEAGLVEERSADELCALRLLGSDQSIPTLEAVLAAIGERAPILVELKTPEGQEGLLERRVADLLAGHNGPVALLSFNPLALAWMAGHAPHLPRGLNAKTEAELTGASLAHADFLSVAAGLASNPAVQAWRKDGVAACWTVRSAAEATRLKPLVDQIIFEGFEP